MTKYFTKRQPAKATLWVSDEVYTDPGKHMPTVDDHVPTFTGLLDADGDEIWREPRAIGFGRRDDW